MELIREKVVFFTLVGLATILFVALIINPELIGPPTILRNLFHPIMKIYEIKSD